MSEAEYERLYRALASSRLQQKLEDDALPADERAFIEKELRRRERAQIEAVTLKRKPRYRSKPVDPKPHSIAVLLIVYAVPPLAMGTWGYISLKRWYDYREFDDSPLLDTLRSFYTCVPVGIREWPIVTLAVLFAMGGYLLYRHPATAILSFLAMLLWCFYGHVFVAIGA